MPENLLEVCYRYGRTDSNFADKVYSVRGCGDVRGR